MLAFLEHGEIEEGAVIYDKVTAKSHGYGFITYKDMKSAQLALRAPSKMIDWLRIRHLEDCRGCKKAIDDPQKMLGVRKFDFSSSIGIKNDSITKTTAEA
ncbi:RNA-binding protein 24 [Striga asiatica]|uniref:RNA-binding protein 24 n=1 Tax=Striga asiatica TaxID=4170 RepID=A0A5A7RIY6_STRAF|nr:RNA-binding protein 24 [Striga asiatica]